MRAHCVRKKVQVQHGNEMIESGRACRRSACANSSFSSSRPRLSLARAPTRESTHARTHTRFSSSRTRCTKRSLAENPKHQTSKRPRPRLLIINSIPLDPAGRCRSCNESHTEAHLAVTRTTVLQELCSHHHRYEQEALEVACCQHD